MDYTLRFVSYPRNAGRSIEFALAIEAMSERDARTVGERMCEVMGWNLIDVEVPAS